MSTSTQREPLNFADVVPPYAKHVPLPPKEILVAMDHEVVAAYRKLLEDLAVALNRIADVMEKRDEAQGGAACPE